MERQRELWVRSWFSMAVAACGCAISQALSAQQSARVLKPVSERVQTCADLSFWKRVVHCSSRRAADCEPEHSQQGSVMPMWAVWTVRAISQCASVSEHDNCGARIITFKQLRGLAAPREQRVCWSGFRRTHRPCVQIACKSEGLRAQNVGTRNERLARYR